MTIIDLINSMSESPKDLIPPSEILLKSIIDYNNAIFELAVPHPDLKPEEGVLEYRKGEKVMREVKEYGGWIMSKEEGESPKVLYSVCLPQTKGSSYEIWDEIASKIIRDVFLNGIFHLREIAKNFSKK